MVKLALFVRLEAKPGKEAAVADFLAGALPLANAEAGTAAWFALKFGPSTFGVFDAFADEAGRQAHLSGPIAAALMANAAALLAEPPTIEKIDLLAVKLRADVAAARSACRRRRGGAVRGEVAERGGEALADGARRSMGASFDHPASGDHHLAPG